MGMLMHHTWLKQQETMKAKTAVEEEIPFNEPLTEEETKAVEAEAEAEKPKAEAKKPKAPAKRPVRRSATKK